MNDLTFSIARGLLKHVVVARNPTVFLELNNYYQNLTSFITVLIESFENIGVANTFSERMRRASKCSVLFPLSGKVLFKQAKKCHIN